MSDRIVQKFENCRAVTFPALPPRKGIFTAPAHMVDCGKDMPKIQDINASLAL